MCQVPVHEHIFCLELSMYLYMNILQFRTIYVHVHEHIVCLELYICTYTCTYRLFRTIYVPGICA